MSLICIDEKKAAGKNLISLFSQASKLLAKNWGENWGTREAILTLILEERIRIGKLTSRL